MSSAAANRRGIIAVVTATAGFSCNDAIVKIVARDLPLGETIFVRGIMTSLLALAFVFVLRETAKLHHGFNRLVLLRSCFEAASAILFTSALLRMRMAELSTIVLISPLIITALSVIFFSESVGWRRWSAIIVGFIGTLFVVKPTPASFDAWAMLGVLVAFSSASRDLLTRQLDSAIPSIVVSFTTAVIVMCAGALLGLWEVWRWPTPREVSLIAGAAMLLAAANYLIVIAFRGAEISVVAPFRYVILIWAGLVGFFVFGEIPDRWSFVGAALIAGSGIYSLHREQVRAREAARRAAEPVPPVPSAIGATIAPKTVIHPKN
ncbi:EamA-like transporter family protein [Variibacter gotjawalensis]|uniref:EamA-like transporter family protein n=1 Tax=Variibacter gotjawalensis TaxID=1333996 RepID=A0A0S3PYY7_9BRAD|nr:DMT family transporter [Variibacter gotjawalensis]NIK46999.1 drug/metabolite transporter (DMT)-like permease [Variibacter gotjawalensis]RZS48903.1 EamA domain-containing membrane protein RarD [Variibacter gotjawalensis]BAT61162.1 EamA-like transporter family protein [Variibacter gotjawalensis]